MYNGGAICEVIPRRVFHCGRSSGISLSDFYAQLHEIVSLNRGTKDGMRKIICRIKEEDNDDEVAGRTSPGSWNLIK